MNWDVLPWREFATTLVLILALVSVQRLIVVYIRRKDEILDGPRRRLISNVRNATFLLILFGLVFIWAPSLRTFALSLTALAVAIILATRELLLCLSGAVMRASTQEIRVGDWVEIAGIRGEVIDQNILAVRLQELPADGRSHDFTGRTVSIPNSLLLTGPVKNERFFKRYVYQTFSLTMDAGIDTERVEKAVLASLADSLASHLEVAKRYNAMIERKASLDIRGVEPMVALETLDDGRVRMTVTAFMPTRHAIAFEQNAVREGLAVIRGENSATVPDGQSGRTRQGTPIRTEA